MLINLSETLDSKPACQLSTFTTYAALRQKSTKLTARLPILLARPLFIVRADTFQGAGAVV